MVDDAPKQVLAAWQAIDKAIGPDATDSQLLIRSKCRAMVRGYAARWAGSGYEPLYVERVLEADLWNPETQRKSRTYRIAGMLDLVAIKDGRRILFDHKTTSEDIAGKDAPYWRQLVVEGQVNHYMLLQWINGEKVDCAVWDVMKKPQIAPRYLLIAQQRAIVSLGDYCDETVSEETKAFIATQPKDRCRENYELYEIRLAQDCTRTRPGWYFQRHDIPRMDREILEYANELWQHGQDMLYTKNGTSDDRLPVRNSGACMAYSSPCRFLGICSGHSKSDSDDWRVKKNVHVELPAMEGDGRDVVTNSRIRCFQTCRRKHYYDYELGIERIDEEKKESLYFGTVWHRALNAYWSTFLRKEPKNGDGNETANEVVRRRQASQLAE